MTAVLISFTMAAVGVLIGWRTYRHCYASPQQLFDRRREASAVLGWGMPLNVVMMAWAVTNVPPIPATGLPAVLVVIAGFIAVTSPFIGIVLGSKQGRKRLAQG